jgi:hypothetical protein
MTRFSEGKTIMLAAALIVNDGGKFLWRVMATRRAQLGASRHHHRARSAALRRFIVRSSIGVEKACTNMLSGDEAA